MRNTKRSSARSTGHARRTFRAPTGFYVPMPAMLDGDYDRRLQGGLPPAPFRSRNDWADTTGRFAREPWACKQIAGEVHGDRHAERGQLKSAQS